MPVSNRSSETSAYRDAATVTRWPHRASYFGSDVPERYGIDYEPLPSFLPLRKPWNGRLDLRSGDLLVVSATNLHAIFLQHWRYRKFNRLLEEVRSDWEPLDVVANSIFVYEVP